MIQQERDPNVYDYNDYTARVDLSQDSATSRDLVTASGITDLDIWLSDTDGGPPIHNELKVRASELAGLPGTYEGIIPGSSIHSRLFGGDGVSTTREGTNIYVVSRNVALNVGGSERVRCIKGRRIS